MGALVQDQSEQSCATLEERLAAAEAEVARLSRELTEALEQQTATADILRVIAGSPTGLQAVLDTIVNVVVRLTRSARMAIDLIDGEVVRHVAAVDPGRFAVGETIDARLHHPGIVAIRKARTIHIPDRTADSFRREYPELESVSASTLHVPLLRKDGAMGSITVIRTPAHPFNPHEISLLESFADQAVIAIENARLFSELEQRNADLQESNRQVSQALEQQTATAEILRVIATSPTDAQPVLDSVVQSALRLSNSNRSILGIREGEQVRVVAAAGRAGHMPEVGQTINLSARRASTMSLREARTIHIPDQSDPSMAVEYADAVPLSPISTLNVPLMRDGAALGVLNLGRATVEPFSPRDIALVEMFADQAVIAIENARLFEELQQRNRDLSEALEQQTVTADVLRVIASSPTDLHAVLDAVAENAARLCDADVAFISRVEGDVVRRVAASHGAPDVIGDASPLDRGWVTARSVLDRVPIHIPDMEEVDPVEFPGARPRYVRHGHRSAVAVPLLRESIGIGAIGVARKQVRPFADEQIKLLEMFADQAVIAIENARLFQELAELNQTLEARVGAQVDQLERVGRLRRYLSPQLSELIVSSGDESILASHRRRITVVFCDLRGFTAFAETEEPEEVMGVLGEYHAAMGDLIRAHEGTFGHFAGDGLMIFFNDPLPQPDHVERAIRMGCAMRERAVELARGWRRAGYELGFGIGIAVGYATLGRIGFEGRYDYDVIGTVANLAARLCAEAADGQILIPGRLHGMIEDLVEVEPVGELSLKGLHRPVVTFNITGIREHGSSPPDEGGGQASDA